MPEFLTSEQNNYQEINYNPNFSEGYVEQSFDEFENYNNEESSLETSSWQTAEISEVRKIEEHEYSSEASTRSEGQIKIIDEHAEIFVERTPLSSLVTGESLERVRSAMELCNRNGHSIWIEQTAESKIYTEFKKTSESGEVSIRIYINPDKHTESLLEKQNLFLQSEISPEEELESFDQSESEFVEFNLANAEENGISIASAEENPEQIAKNNVERFENWFSNMIEGQKIAGQDQQSPNQNIADIDPEQARLPQKGSEAKVLNNKVWIN